MRTPLRLLAGLALLLPCLIYGQVEPVPVMASDRNWTSSISYDFSGATISKGVSFFNNLGKGVQQQSWDVLTGRVWSSEVRYDVFGRAALQTLSAPQGSWFGYNSGFMLTGGSPFGASNFDSSATLWNPAAISAQPNTLGWYYSTSNTLDAYQDVTGYPYTRTVFSTLNPGAVLAVLGGNKINIGGSERWLQGYSFVMPIEQGLPTEHFYDAFRNKKIAKTVSRDINGIETVVFTDTDGNTLGAARSGNEESAVASRTVYSEILDKGFADIHIPTGCSGLVSLSNTANTDIVVYDLVTENIVSLTWSGGSATMVPGFYRFEDRNNYYGKTNTDAVPVTPVKITYKSNYYDLSINSYDYAGRLRKSVQPLGSLGSTPLQSTFQYNSLGQLLTTTSPDEGASRFLYRRDGQIRFSQNAEQVKVNDISYTDYDGLGRPIESGVAHLEISFEDMDAYTDTPLSDIGDLSGYRERNFTAYDMPDPELPALLKDCGIPPEYMQTFVAGNVSVTHTENPTTNKTWYGYDVYGRVRWMVQQVSGLSCLKTIDYEYDPVNGQLIKIRYQKYNASESFTHSYTYNMAGQLTDVYTSTDESLGTRQAHYIYNESGALKRTELADNLQGIDYVYNLQGQLKAINHPSLLTANDPGGDGTNGFASDLFGMAIDYYNGDYARSNPPKPVTTTAQGTDRYDGNIKATRWNTQTASATTAAYTYQYNKNSWLTNATFGSAGSNAAFRSNANEDYKVSGIAYDANGNILSLTRKGYTSTPGTNRMDEFAYSYKGNRLAYVKDEGDNSDPLRYNDIKDQEVRTPGAVVLGIQTYNEADNYVYNDLGQLVTNIQEGVAYEYNASGLVTKINELYPVDSGTYLTLDYDDYPDLMDVKKVWSAGSPELVPQILVCDSLPETSNLLCIHGTPVTSTTIRIAPNTFHKLDLDIVVDKKLWIRPEHQEPGGEIEPVESWGTSGATVVPNVVVKLKKADGTLIASQTISDQAAEYCGQFFDEHVAMSYTSGNEEYLILELTVTNNDTFGMDGDQRIFIDNFHLQAAMNNKIELTYNDRGQRVQKTSHINSRNLMNTWYVRDVSGNVMAVYTQGIGPDAGATPLGVAEHAVYGLGRIGVFKRGFHDGGFTLYELTDNLGNVRAIFKKAGSGIIALTGKTDYYPFGMPMPNRQVTDNNYRYAFQGQEKDPETNMEAFELRLWDGRLGRWLTVDPMGQYFSPYLGMGNNPISHVDRNGGWDGDPPTDGSCSDGDTWNDGTSSWYNVEGIWHNAAITGPVVMTGTKSYSLSDLGNDYLHAMNSADSFMEKNALAPMQFMANLIPFVAAANSYSGFTQDQDIYGEQMGKGAATLNGVCAVLPFIKFGSLFSSGGEIVAESGVTNVYTSVTTEGATQYVGITNNLAKRAAAHLASKGIAIEPLMEGISRSDARAVEQALIEIHGLGKNGGTLLNKINSISVNNPVYAAQLERGYELLKSIGYGAN